MSSKEIDDYYQATENRELRRSLITAVEKVKARFNDVVAVDCGCGAGRDIAFLSDQGFTVYGFDLESEAIRRCQQRFATSEQVYLKQASFSDFSFPRAELISADASLFYCPENDFTMVWQKICGALAPGGVFVGSFLGERDTTASAEYEPEKYWPDVMAVNEAELRQYLTQFNVLQWTEHELDGKTPEGKDHHWHIFELILEKREE